MKQTYFSRLGAACISLLSVFIVSCSSVPELPALSQNQVKRVGQVVWRDLVTNQPQDVKDFYQNVFGWQYTDVNDDYSLINYEGNIIGGIAGIERTTTNYWMPVVSTDSIEKSVKQAKAAGGKPLINKTNIPGRGDIAVIQDDQGAVFSVIDTVSGDPVALPKLNNSWMWQEIWTGDTAKTQAFYQTLNAYNVEQYNKNENSYTYLSLNGEPAFGIIKKPNDDVPTAWVNYIKVNDIKQALSRVKQFGGDVLMAPTDRVRSGTVAIVRDPAGAGFVIQELDNAKK